MNSRAILSRIINENGNCTWSNRQICAACPLSRLKQHPNGAYMSCIESVGAHELSEEDADKRYKEVAIAVLMDVEVDTILKKEGEGDDKQG